MIRAQAEAASRRTWAQRKASAAAWSGVSPPDDGRALLASDSARFVTGIELVVDGGLTVKPPDGFPETVQKIVTVCGGSA